MRLAGGADMDSWGHLALQVLPMGCKSAVDILRAVRRRLTSSEPKNSARHPGFGEVGGTEVMPTSADWRAQRAWPVRFDNHASLGVHGR